MKNLTIFINERLKLNNDTKIEKKPFGEEKLNEVTEKFIEYVNKYTKTVKLSLGSIVSITIGFKSWDPLGYLMFYFDTKDKHDILKEELRNTVIAKNHLVGSIDSLKINDRFKRKIFNENKKISGISLRLNALGFDNEYLDEFKDDKELNTIGAIISENYR